MKYVAMTQSDDGCWYALREDGALYAIYYEDDFTRRGKRTLKTELICKLPNEETNQNG